MCQDKAVPSTYELLRVTVHICGVPVCAASLEKCIKELRSWVKHYATLMLDLWKRDITLKRSSSGGALP